MAYSRKDVDKTKQNAKKFVRYQEGAEKYSMGLTKFTALAKEAKAVYKIDKVTLVNCEILNGIWNRSVKFSLHSLSDINKQNSPKCAYALRRGLGEMLLL